MEAAFKATTNGITVRVCVAYLDDHSDPAKRQFLWGYSVTIINGGEETIQLLERTWEITDAQGRVNRVQGEGVNGEQPVLSPGAQFSYSSHAPLALPSGFMRGSYQMQSLPGAVLFDVAVPPFSLDSPYQNPQRH